MLNATSHIRAVARIELPSTKAEIIRVRSMLLSLFMLPLCLSWSSMSRTILLTGWLGS